MDQGPAGGADALASYGMCRRCLSHNLRRLDVLRGHPDSFAVHRSSGAPR